MKRASSLLLFSMALGVFLSFALLPPYGANADLSTPTATRVPIPDIKTWIQQYQASPPVQPPARDQVFEEHALAPGHETMFLEPTLLQPGPLASTTLYSTADACVLQGYPDVNAGSTSDMWAGYDTYLDPHGEIVRSLSRSKF